ncbi:MAG: tRNA (adenosine(37)-N6)-threonylcarbamoyltransferase complex ATPase subunit type 1 TsaE [Cytophagales bacterium]|nr:tRNA (adenosine(37)-N6)-threonylcarbamoyltransferase complex ATPase subunit type 1 TsaE [Cytophagales bacterium]
MILDRYTEADLSDVAKTLIKQAGDKRIWCFYGEMGAGKTTLIKEICLELGVLDAMSSPTFSIVNEYLDDLGESIYHFDFYRLKEENEALDIGIEDYFYSESYCFIEWPEKIPNLIPEAHLKININLVDEKTRSINLERT